MRGYKERLSQQPGNPEEFVAHAALIAEVEGARPDMDKEYDLVRGGMSSARWHGSCHAGLLPHGRMGANQARCKVPAYEATPQKPRGPY